jgi:hypothetical protein
VIVRTRGGARRSGGKRKQDLRLSWIISKQRLSFFWGGVFGFRRRAIRPGWLFFSGKASKQASEGSFSMVVSGFFFKANYTRGFFGAVAGFFFFTRCFSQIMPLVSHSFALELKHSSPPNAVA